MPFNSLIYASIAGAATLLGILVVMWKRDSAIKYSHYINSFAAGALITIALTHLVPESIELAGNALLGVLLSFIAFYLLETVLVIHSGSEIHYAGEERPTKAPVLFSGLFLHSLIDGVIIVAGFEVSTELGLFAATGVILHELPEGVTSFALLLRSMSRKRALGLSLAVALATPFGALIALGPLSTITEAGLGMMMAVAAGSFLYVAASDLIPETHEKNAVANAVFLLIGAGFLYFLSTLFE